MARGAYSIGAFAALPFLALISSNPGNSLPLGRLLLYWATITGLATLVVALIWRNNQAMSQRVAAVTALTLYAFGQLAVELSRAIGLSHILELSGAVWMFLVIVLAAILVSRWRVTQSFVAFSGSLLLLAGLLGAVVNTEQIPIANARATTWSKWDLNARTTPNVYWFILDGYGRADVLEHYYGYSSQQRFINELEVRDFSLSPKAFAAYPMTYLSVASTLAADYLVSDEDTAHDEGRFVGMAQEGGNVLKTLRSWGYSYLLWPGDGFRGTSCSGFEDICLRTDSWIQGPERAILEMTPLGSIGDLTSSRGHFARSDPIAAVDSVLDVGVASPTFSVLHLINPHPPHYQTGRECAFQEVSFDLGAAYGVSDYIDSVRCLNIRLLKAVDRIIEIDQTALIILQGDHGPSWSLSVHTDDLDEWDRKQIEIRLGTLSAMRLPNGCTAPATMSLPNTFRVIFDCLSTDRVPLLPDRMWIANQDPGHLREVEPLDHEVRASN